MTRPFLFLACCLLAGCNHPPHATCHDYREMVMWESRDEWVPDGWIGPVSRTVCVVGEQKIEAPK